MPTWIVPPPASCPCPPGSHSTPPAAAGHLVRDSVLCLLKPLYSVLKYRIDSIYVVLWIQRYLLVPVYFLAFKNQSFLHRCTVFASLIGFEPVRLLTRDGHSRFLFFRAITLMASRKKKWRRDGATELNPKHWHSVQEKKMRICALRSYREVRGQRQVEPHLTLIHAAKGHKRFSCFKK